MPLDFPEFAIIFPAILGDHKRFSMHCHIWRVRSIVLAIMREGIWIMHTDNVGKWYDFEQLLLALQATNLC